MSTDTCNGSCCPRPYGTGPRRPFEVCYHEHTCAWHTGHPDAGDRLTEQAYTFRGPGTWRPTVQQQSSRAT